MLFSLVVMVLPPGRNGSKIARLGEWENREGDYFQNLTGHSHIPPPALALCLALAAVGGNAALAVIIFQMIVATLLFYLLEFLTFCQHFNNFFHTLLSCLLFFCGLEAKSNGEKIGLIEAHKKRFCFFVFAKLF